jgi:hypothetical protein
VGIIVPVLLGSDTEIPEALREFEAIRIDRPEQIEEIANGVARRSVGPGSAVNFTRQSTRK